MALGAVAWTALATPDATTFNRSCPLCPGYLIILNPKIYESRFESDADFDKRKYKIVLLCLEKNKDRSKKSVKITREAE